MKDSESLILIDQLLDIARAEDREKNKNKQNISGECFWVQHLLLLKALIKKEQSILD